MKKFINTILVLAILFMGVNSAALAKKVKTDTKTKVVKEKIKTPKAEKQKAPKVKKEKAKTEKVKTQKTKPEKVKTEKVKPQKVKAQKAPKVKAEKAQKPEKIKKAKKEKTPKVAKEKKSKKDKVSKKNQDEVKVSKKTKKKKVKDLSSLTQVEREKALLETPYQNKKRSALAMYLNPNLDITEIRASHILVRNRKDAVSIRKDILDGKITFEQAAKQYSLCPTGVNGGDLGYFNRKRMDQQFTDRAFDLKIGQISDPVGTKFGWHLIKVVDKR